jgi:ABC-type phosphate transport system permease subunit
MSGAVAWRAPLAFRPSTSDDAGEIMATPTADSPLPPADPIADVAPMRRRLAPPGGADRVFRIILRAAGTAVLARMAMVGLFLFTRAGEALRVAGRSFLTTSAWEPDSHHFGIAAVLTGTVLIALVAILLAVPLATGMALYVSEYAPRGRSARWPAWST